MHEPADEQPNAGVHEPIVVGVPVELALAAALLAHQNDQLDRQIDGEKGDVRPPDDRVAEQVDAIVVAGEELTLREGMDFREKIRISHQRSSSR